MKTMNFAEALAQFEQSRHDLKTSEYEDAPDIAANELAARNEQSTIDQAFEDDFVDNFGTWGWSP